MMKTFLPFVFPIFLLSMVLSLSIPVRAQALRTPDRPVASIQEFGPEVSLEVTFNRPVRYVTHPDGGLTVQHTPGLEVTGISTATADRGGAMWNPGQGEQGYGRWQPQGFDSFMRNKGGRNTYDASLNVSPAATGSPFPVPGEGSLVIAIPRQTTKANRVVRLYRVMNFAEHLPPEGTYRAPVRGMTAPRRNWRQSRVHENLKKVFPPDMELKWTGGEPEAGDRLRRWRAWGATGVYYTAWGSQQVSPAEGLSWYGRDLAKALGVALIDLRNEDRDEAYRTALADAIVQRGIDLYGTILDGSYWQMNGGWTCGRIWMVEFAGVLLEDEYMLNMVAAPLDRQSAPGQVLEVIPFVETRQFSPVQPVGEYFTRGTRPEVSDQMEKWGSVVGADPNEQLALVPADVGLRYWTIQNDRAYGKRSQLSSWIKRPYHGVNLSGQIMVRVAYGLIEQAGHIDAFSGTRGERHGLDTSLLQWWQMRQNMGELHAQNMIPKPHKLIKGIPGGLFGDWSQSPRKGLIDINTLAKSPPGRAYPPLLTDEGNGVVSVQYNAYQPVHGHKLLHHDVRWSIDDGETWQSARGPDNGLEIRTEAPSGTKVLVQTRITTPAGTGGWSPTMTVNHFGKHITYGEIVLGE